MLPAASQPGTTEKQSHAEDEKEEKEQATRVSGVMSSYAGAEVSATAATGAGGAEATGAAARRDAHVAQPGVAAPRAGARHGGADRGPAAQSAYNNRALADAAASAGTVGAMATVDADFDSGEAGDVELHEEHGFVEYSHDLMDALEDGLDGLHPPFSARWCATKAQENESL